MMPTLDILIIFAAFIGFLIVSYIAHKKRAQEVLVCPIGSDCNAVIHSKYSNFLGIPLEFLGIIYYGVIAVGYGIILAYPEISLPFLKFGLVTMTLLAFLFSLYLTFIQAFVIKEWCAWCLTSALICSVIFSLAFRESIFAFIQFLAAYKEFIVIAHVAGMAIGLGAATLTDIFFFRFLKDFRISEEEQDVLHTLSQVIWFALGIIVLTGISIYLPNRTELNQSPQFLMKMLTVLIIIINGALLNLLIAPRLVKISFGEHHHHQPGELHHIRRIAFALGAVSIISWYTAFAIASLKVYLPANFSLILIGYLIAITIGVGSSQVMERLFAKRSGE